jgi:nucleotide-binding universal stress UspA family protein
VERFRKILLYVEPEQGGGAALDRALGVCKRSGAALRLLAVVPEMPVYLRYPQFAYPSLAETLRQEAEQGLAKLAAAAREVGVDVSTKVREGKPFLEIAREALSGGFDLAMLTAEEESAAVRLTGLAMHLFRVCPCPVWAVRPTHAGPYRRVLAAVDPSAPEPEGRGLNEEILELALSLGELEGARVDVLHAWEGERAGADLREQVGALASEAFEKALAPYGTGFPKENVHLVEGAPACVIPDFVETNGVDLLVMGTLVRTGVAGFLIGNTAEKVLGRVDCSVLALKPAGFRSPVEEEPEKE